jgi:hypothetical protein
MSFGTFLDCSSRLVSLPKKKSLNSHANLHSPKEWSGLAYSPQLLKVPNSIQSDRQSHQATGRRIL